MGSDWGEFWRRILRFSWFGHQSLFDLIPTFVVPCTTGHLVSVAIVCFLPYRDWSKIESKDLWRIASLSWLAHSRLRWRPRFVDARHSSGIHTPTTLTGKCATLSAANPPRC